MRGQFCTENLTRWAWDQLANLRQRDKKSVADFLYKFREVCLKISDLSEAEKLDRFLRALAPNVRMQVELKLPTTFHEAAMHAERADTVLTRVSGQGPGGRWLKFNAVQGGPRPFHTKPSTSGPEPMEIGTI